MDHVVLPLDATHCEALAALQRRAVGTRPPTGLRAARGAHVTVASFSDLDRAVAARALLRAVSPLAPFTIRAHGFGVFTGEDGHRTLNVQVVRGPALAQLHAAVLQALEGAGAVIAEWTQPDLWTPHITVLDEGPAGRGVVEGIRRLADHHHPSWRIPIDRLLVIGAASDPCRHGHLVRLSPAGAATSS